MYSLPIHLGYTYPTLNYYPRILFQKITSSKKGTNDNLFISKQEHSPLPSATCYFIVIHFLHYHYFTTSLPQLHVATFFLTSKAICRNLSNSLLKNWEIRCNNDRSIMGKLVMENETEELVKRFLKIYFGHQDESCKEAIMNLHNDQLVDIKVIRNFLIVQDYMQELQNWDGISIKAIEVIAMKYSMSTRQIQNVLYKWEGKFRGVNRKGN